MNRTLCANMNIRERSRVRGVQATVGWSISKTAIIIPATDLISLLILLLLLLLLSSSSSSSSLLFLLGRPLQKSLIPSFLFGLGWHIAWLFLKWMCQCASTDGVRF